VEGRALPGAETVILPRAGISDWRGGTESGIGHPAPSQAPQVLVLSGNSSLGSC